MELAVRRLAFGCLIVLAVSASAVAEDVSSLVADLAHPSALRRVAAFGRISHRLASISRADVIDRRALVDGTLGLVDDQSPSVRSLSLSAIVNCATIGVGQSPVLRAEAFELLRTRATTESHRTVRAAIARGLGSLGLRGGLAILQDMSREGTHGVRRAAVQSLVGLGAGDPAFLDEITPFLLNRLSIEVADIAVAGNDGTAAAIMRMLPRLDDRRVLVPLAALRDNPYLGAGYVRAWAAVAVKERYDEIDPELPGGASVLRHPHSITREDSDMAMGLLRSAQTHPDEATALLAREEVAEIERLDAIHAEAVTRFAEQSALHEQP